MSNHPFEPGLVGGIKVKNRIVRSATHESMAIQGIPSSDYFEMYQNLAKGEVGTIITGFMGFSTLDNISPGTVRIDSDNAIPKLKTLTDMVHTHGTKIVVQLGHSGSQLMHPPTGNVYAPSDVIDPVSGIKPTPLNRTQIQTLVKEFGAAALRAKKSGFDGIQIHGAHGYLLSKFLSPVYNKRTDEYGGSPEKNSQIILEILREIKTACGAGFPVWLKLNCSDFEKQGDGFTFDDATVTAEIVSQNGIDAIELSGGTFVGKHLACRPKSQESYHLEYAEKLLSIINTPIILVGGNRNIDKIEKILSDTNIDAVSICRPLIREPFLVKRWMDGDRRDAECIACNGCFNPNGAICFFTLNEEEKEVQKGIMKMINSLRR